MIYDSIVTNPTYDVTEPIESWLRGEGYCKIWLSAFENLKPGAHVAVFPENNHHLHMIALRISGFEIRDTISYLTDIKTQFIILARKPLMTTIDKNFAIYGTGALNTDISRIPTEDKLSGGAAKEIQSVKPEGWDRPWRHDPNAAKAHSLRIKANIEKAEKLGRFPNNVIHDGSYEIRKQFQLYGIRKSGNPGIRRKNHSTHSMSGRLSKTNKLETGYGDTGSISRFFYSTNDAMMYITNMITPINGKVLDPFK